MEKFPSMKAKELLRLLQKKPLNYTIIRQRGSHKRLKSDVGDTFTFAYHGSEELSGKQVFYILVVQVGLSETFAMEVLK